VVGLLTGGQNQSGKASFNVLTTQSPEEFYLTTRFSSGGREGEGGPEVSGCVSRANLQILFDKA